MTDRVQVCQLCGIRTTHVDPNGEPLCSEHGGTLHASSNSAANEGADYVIARALRERHPDYKMPELMAWDIVKRLAEAGLEIRRAIPNRVQKSSHPYRLTWTKMARLEIPPEQPVGLRRNARGHRRRWHILKDGEPLCERATASDLGQIRPWGDVRGDQACDRCHHEFSWTPLPHDTEERDLGYETPCWVWTRGLDDDGYGQYGRRRRHLGTHRAAYIAEYGDPPEGYVVHHLCGQAACLRPDHLEAMPRSEHIRLHRPELAPGSAALKRKP